MFSTITTVKLCYLYSAESQPNFSRRSTIGHDDAAQIDHTFEAGMRRWRYGSVPHGADFLDLGDVDARILVAQAEGQVLAAQVGRAAAPRSQPGRAAGTCSGAGRGAGRGGGFESRAHGEGPLVTMDGFSVSTGLGKS